MLTFFDFISEKLFLVINIAAPPNTYSRRAKEGSITRDVTVRLVVLGHSMASRCLN